MHGRRSADTVAALLAARAPAPRPSADQPLRGRGRGGGDGDRRRRRPGRDRAALGGGDLRAPRARRSPGCAPLACRCRPSSSPPTTCGTASPTRRAISRRHAGSASTRPTRSSRGRRGRRRRGAGRRCRCGLGDRPRPGSTPTPRCRPDRRCAGRTAACVVAVIRKCVRTCPCVMQPGAADPARRPRLLLRLGRAARRPRAARAAGDRRRRGRARRELRGEGVRRALGDGRRPGPRAVPARRRRRRRASTPTSRRARRCSRSSRTPRRWSRASRSTRRSSTSPGWLKVSGTPARDRDRGCARRVRDEVGLAITVGVARTKFLAKVASGVAKPDGLLVVPADGELDVPAPAAGAAAVGRRPGHRRQAARARDRHRARRRRASTRPRWCRCSGGRPAGTCTRSRTTATRARCRSGGAAARSARSARSGAGGRIAARTRHRARRHRRPGRAGGCARPSGSAAPWCCGCASTTSAGPPARTRWPSRPTTRPRSWRRCAACSRSRRR